MSVAKVVESSTATLLDSAPSILLSVIVGVVTPAPAGVTTIELHNANSATDTLDTSNLKVKLALAGPSFDTTGGFSHTFDGVMFPKGIVIKCSSAIPVTVEYE